MFNIFEFIKIITNAGKLDRELRLHSSFGSVYNYLSIKGDLVKVHFTQNLNQAQIDDLSSFMSGFSNVSVYETLNNYLKSDITPFITELLLKIQAENIELGITQLGKTVEVLGFFEAPVVLPGKTRAISLKGTTDTNSLTASLELLGYYIQNPNLYSDLSPFITQVRLTSMYNEIATHLGAPTI